MIIYGTALLAVCHLLGIFLGDLLGQALGVKTNVGGLGIAMLLLIFARLYMHKRAILPKLTELGVEYWGAMYIPVVVAMAAQQDMVAALRGGPVAVLSAINRLYFTTFQFKRAGAHVERMSLKPERLKERLDRIANAAPSDASEELRTLVEDTKTIVAVEMPDVDVTVAWNPIPDP